MRWGDFRERNNQTDRSRDTSAACYARFLVRNVDHADDIVQECLTQVITKVDSWKPGTNLRAWLIASLTNCYFNEMRRTSRSPIVNVPEPPLGAAPSKQDARMTLL